MAIAFNEIGSFSGVDGGASVLNNPTSLQFGPDGRLYVAEQNGTINAFTVEIQDGEYVATAHEVLVDINGNDVVQNIQNHNDDGSLSNQSNRQVTGIVVTDDGSGNPILYISSSDPRISSNNDVGLDTNSGVITRVTWDGTNWQTLDIVRGLPRSEENHSTNGLALNAEGTMLYVQNGGNTNNGAPSQFFSYTAEYALSGALLEIDLTAIDDLPVLEDQAGGQGGVARNYVYDLPTLDDPTIENVDGGGGEDSVGLDEAGPWGGNDGLNMAILPSDAPIRIYADGFRNPYDIVITADGDFFTVDNGSNGGLGGDPNTENTDDDGDGIVNEAINTVNGGGSGDPEPLFFIEDGGYYGHPNPTRSNQNQEWIVYDDSGNVVTTAADISALVPAGVDIDDGFIIDPSKFTDDAERLFESGVRVERSSGQTNALVTVGSSSNGLAEYDSGGTAFGGVLDGMLLVAQFNNNITLLNPNDANNGMDPIVDDDGLQLSADGVLQLNTFGVTGLGVPLDVTVGPDGTIWVAELGADFVTIFAPGDLVLPGDPDFDNDGILNASDPFQRDASNGGSAIAFPGQTLEWTFAASGTGNDNPGPAGFGGGLTGVMVNGTTDFEEFFQEPSTLPNQDVKLDNVKFTTAAGGGTTVIEFVSNGDPFSGGNNGEYLFQTGVTIPPTAETVTISWSMFNPGTAFTGNYQQIGGYIGTGDQSNYLKVVAIQHGSGEIQVTLENNDSPAESFIQADDLFLVAPTDDKKIFIDLLIDLTAETATPTVTYETATGQTTVNGAPVDLSGSNVLEAIKGNWQVDGQDTGLAVGLFSTNNGQPAGNTFQAVFDDITVSTTASGEAEVLYRVNAGGSLIAAIDGGLDWQPDTGFLADAGSNNTTGFPAVEPGPTVPLFSTPPTIFDTERWDNAGGTEMQWAFDTPTAALYEVRLYMGNGFGGTSGPGQRVFDVSIEGNVPSNLDDVDLSAQFGHEVGGMISNVVQVVDGELNIEFIHGIENPLINGIEIIQLEEVDVTPVVSIVSGDQPVSESAGQLQISLLTDVTVPAAESVTVTFEIVPGTATAGGVDYDYTSGTATFDPATGIYTDSVTIAGSSSDATFFIDIIDDALGEAGEAFSVNIIDVGANAAIGDGTANIVILDNDLQPGDVLFRINSGGPEVASTDSGPDWSADQNPNPTPFLVAGGENTFGLAATITVNPGDVNDAPPAIFDNERWDPGSGAEMKYEFANLAPGNYTVNLYIVEGFLTPGGTGNRVFDVSVEGVVPTVFDDIAPLTDFGNTAFVLSHTQTVNDGTLDLEFLHTGIDNPAIRGIEIVAAEIPVDESIVAAINAGGPALVQDNIQFQADDHFLNGTVFVDGGAGNGEQPIFDGTVYETERYGGAPGTAALAYEIPVAAGFYTLEFYFAEIFQPNDGTDGIGNRVFDVEVEGITVLDDLDILAATGGDINQPVVIQVPGLVDPAAFGNTGAIDIDFGASADNAKISAMVVRQASAPDPAGGSAVLTVNDGANGIETSNFGDGSFEITNTGAKDITFIEIDVTDALFPEAVFDPFGLAGDQTGKILTVNGGDGGTGLVVPTGGFDEDAIGITYIGAGGIDGYEKIRLEFTDFNPGETLSFGVDMDPNSIAGAVKGILDSGSPLAGAGGDNIWDIGGIGGAELAGSLFTVGYTDTTTSTGKLHGQGTGEQMGAEALSSQDSAGLAVTLSVNGLGEGAEGTYTTGGPTITIQGPAGEMARVLVAKGFIVPFTNEFPESDPYHAQLDAQIAALEASGFPANNAVEMLYVDVALDGSVQDISSLFDFTQVQQFDLSVPDQTNEFGELNEARLPLGIVASVIDVATDQPLGPVTSPIHLTFEGNDPPDIDPIDDITIEETQEAAFLINATDPEGDAVTLSVEVVRDSDSAVVDPGEYTFTDNGDGTGSFSWLTDDADGGTYTVTVTADDTFGQSQEVFSLTVNDPGVEQFGAAVLTVNNGNNDIEGSNFGDGSWAITNVGDKNISFIEIDVTDALFPDAVFDPFGLAGDQLGKLFSPNGGDGGTGLAVPAGGFDEDAIGITYLGAGGSDGFEKIRLEFTDFNPGETLSFSIDMDPNSIAGAIKSTLDSGAVLAGAGQWDVGGIGGAELAGSLFTVGYTDATESTGQLQGQGTGEQIGAEALSSQASAGLGVTLSVNGLGEGAEGTYTTGGPTITIQGPAGEMARVLVAKGFIVPFTNEFPESDPYHAQLDAQIAALEASGFPANNAVEMQYVDIALTGAVQDISSLFNFTQVQQFDLSVPDQTNEFGELNEARLPLGVVASVIDPATDQSLGPVTSPIHLTWESSGTEQTLIVRAAGTGGAGTPPQFQVFADDVLLGTQSILNPQPTSINVSNDALFLDYGFTFDGSSPTKVEIVYFNDGTTGGINRDLVVDYISVNGTVFESEIDGFFTADNGNPIFEGAREKLFVNGTLTFDNLPDTGGGGGNTAPVIVPIEDITITEGQTAAFAVSSTDADGDSITLSVDVKRSSDSTVVDPAEYSFTDNGNGSGSFEWLTDDADDGAYTVTVTADDTEDQTEEVLALVVNDTVPGNTPPTIVPIGDVTITEGQTAQFAVSSSDVDGDIPTLTVAVTRNSNGQVISPAEYSFIDTGDGTGSFSWLTDNMDDGVYTATVTASDTVSQTQETVTLTVNDTGGGGSQSLIVRAAGKGSAGAPPQFEVFADGVSLGTRSILNPQPTDINVNDDALFLSYAFAFDGASPGTVDIVYFNDGSTGGINRDLVIDYIDLSGTVFEAEVDGFFTPNNGNPIFAGPREKLFVNGTLRFDDLPDTGGGGGGNTPPQISAIADITITEGATASFDVNAFDTDGDALTLSVEVKRNSDGTTVDPAEYSFTDNLNGTGSFQWLTDAADDGVYTVTVTADDSSAQDTEVLTLTVNDEGGGGGTEQTLIVRAAGTGSAGTPPQFEVFADGLSLGTRSISNPQPASINVNDDSVFLDYTFVFEDDAVGSVDVVYFNDGTTGGINRNLVVDFIDLNGTVFESEVDGFFTADNGNAIFEGPREKLWVNGTLAFDDLVA